MKSMATDSRSILLLYVHPAHQRSKVNATLLEAVADLDGVTVNDLYQEYPRFDVNVAREQELLLAHDIVVVQHPFFWYSVPALYREWQDLVLEHGWAYGGEGNSLRDKWVVHAVSTGGSAEAYCDRGYNRHSMAELLRSHEQTARVCGMRYLEPFVVHGTHLMTVERRAVHAARYREYLLALQDVSRDPGSVAPSDFALSGVRLSEQGEERRHA
jgi:glutathione-regulated potassium-efflux system ancillary protein KefG